MRKNESSERIDRDRRRLLGAAAMGIAAVGAASPFPARPAAAAEETIRPFRVNVPEEQLVDLRRRIAATRWPERETVGDDSQGVQLSALQEIARYWRTDYDWRKAEAKLNALPQFIIEIDGLDIHFIHVRSKHENALPLIVTHGWPGSVIEQLKIIDPLTNPTADGGSASDAFHVVIPSLPGFGFSGKPTATGWGPERTARAWVTLMKRLGYMQFVAQGGDLGAGVCTAMARQAPPELLGNPHQFAWYDSAGHCEVARGRRPAAVRPGEATCLCPDDGDAAANAVRAGRLAYRRRSLDSRPW
jgi:hypothetical protein